MSFDDLVVSIACTLAAMAMGVMSVYGMLPG